MTDITELTAIVTRLASTVEKLTEQVVAIKNPTLVEEISEAPAKARSLEIKPEHNFVVVNESDYADDLTESGRTLLDARDSFATLEEAREYAHLATERPLYIGEVGRSEDESTLKVRLKLRYASSL